MNLSAIIQKIRATTINAQPTMFGQRVAGAAEYLAVEDKGALSLPAAYVIPDGESTEVIAQANDMILNLTFVLGVMVVVSNRTPPAGGARDERGQAAYTNDINLARTHLFKALLNWEPDSQSSPITYLDGALVAMNDHALHWLFRFSYSRHVIGSEEGSTPGDLTDFLKAYTDTDAIDPAADPNVQYPGPDGRIEVEMETDIPQ